MGGGVRIVKTAKEIIKIGTFFFISWESITTGASPNGIPRDIYSTYVVYKLEWFNSVVCSYVTVEL